MTLQGIEILLVQERHHGNLLVFTPPIGEFGTKKAAERLATSQMEDGHPVPFNTLLLHSGVFQFQMQSHKIKTSLHLSKESSAQRMTEMSLNAVDLEDSKKPRDIVGRLHGKKNNE